MGACPQNDVMILVSAEQGSVPATVIGYDFECTRGDDVTVCRPAAIADGEYQLIVQADGYEPQQVALTVRTNVAPSFSCQCEIPAGSASIELGASHPPPDAGTLSPDAGTPLPDGGGA